MKRVFSVVLAFLLVASMIPAAHAEWACPMGCWDSYQRCQYGHDFDCLGCSHCADCAEQGICDCDYCAEGLIGAGHGTLVEYDAADDANIGDSNGDGVPDNMEYYIVVVPAKLAPGEAGTVYAAGTWAFNRELVVTADDDVSLLNLGSKSDEKVLGVDFPGLNILGSNVSALYGEEAVAVEGMSNAFFGKWAGIFEYQVELVYSGDEFEFTIMHNNEEHTYTAIEGMTWGEWVTSEFNTSATEGCPQAERIAIIEGRDSTEYVGCDYDPVEVNYVGMRPDDIIFEDVVYEIRHK
jgi:hypothetical protein